MNFRDLKLPDEIYTTDQNPIETFFNPILKLSHEYIVAVGYFNSGWFRDASAGIASLIHNKGNSKWIINPELTKDDWEIFDELPDTEKEKWIEQKIDISIEILMESLENDTRNTIAWLVHENVLEFKIAVPTRNLSGIFHPKIGVFTDIDGNKIAFTGSYNHTVKAAFNWEHIEIFKSWENSTRISSKEEKFYTMWNEKDPNLSICPPSEKSIRKIVSFKGDRPSIEPVVSCLSEPHIPEYFLTDGKLRKHQEEAIYAWFKNNGHGIFHMATGSGKTVTALATAVRLLDFAKKKSSGIGIIVTVPYKHLADQWEKEAINFGFDPIICYGNYKDWIDIVSKTLIDFKMKLKNHYFFITSNATFQKDKFQTYLKNIDTNFLFIADEMHNLGGDKIKKVLPQNAKFRMGLSATPDRHYDKQGTELLKNYFDKVVIEYGIKEAIRDETLCEYYYYPIIVNFTPEEDQEYKILSRRIGILSSDEEKNEDSLKLLLIKRSRLIANADNKIIELVKILKENSHSNYNLIYCGDEIEYDNFSNKIEDDDVDNSLRQVEKILKILGSEIGMKASKFTAVETIEKRQRILSQFSSAELQALIAIRCLDEGVDVPRTETAYILASTSNPRQFIQRRGRVLRKAKGKKFATIYDFIVMPSDKSFFSDSSFNVERKLIERELARVKEFAEISLNPGDTIKRFRIIKQKYNLMDL
ncbi:MAG: DEAD/DEAH box helicase family protein [Candidatus Delongbacteria bacterium]|nr:DEAD/DEAH box helicase family protein [Candidatus Delongbacteria bacterium]